MAEQEAKKPGSEFKHIVRVANADLDGAKPLVMGLQKIRGVGHMFAHTICTLAKISPTHKTGELSDAQISKLDELVNNPIKNNAPLWILNRRKDPEDGEDKHLITGDLKFNQENDVKMLKKIKAYRGMRHAAGLPVRGQRTKSNFRKNKGKVTGVAKKKLGQPPAERKK